MKKEIISLKKYLKKKIFVFTLGILVITLIFATIFLIFARNLPNEISKKFIPLEVSNFIKKASIQAQTLPLFFFPEFPQRLAYLTAEISHISKNIASSTEELLTQMRQCNCEYAQSLCSFDKIRGCQPFGVAGEICPLPQREGEEKKDNLLTIEQRKSEINQLTYHLSLLEELLKQEKEDPGFQQQLMTLREEDAQNLRENIEFTQEEISKIKELASSTLALTDQCSPKNCIPHCTQGRFSFDMCLLPGEQVPMKFKFKVEAGLKDLEFEKFKIEKVKLNLPEKIEISPLPQLPDFKIPIPDLTLTCPTEERKITLPLPSPPPLPESPTLTFGCPEYSPPQSYQCNGPSNFSTSTSLFDLSWYSETFSWLSKKCQQLFGIENQSGPSEEFIECFGNPNLSPDELPEECKELIEQIEQQPAGEPFNQEELEELKDCYNPEKVHQRIIEECKNFWANYQGQSPIPEICISLGKPCLGEALAKQRECKNIFNEVNEEPPPECSLEIIEASENIYCNNTENKYATPESISRVISTLEKKCQEIKNKKQHQVPPEPCKFLPLFTTNFSPPLADYEYSSPEQSCPTSTITSSPKLPISDCALSAPYVPPKISLPKITIPDIYLPSFGVPPFFYVKLPNIIFEDLKLPDIELCDLSDCQFKFPSLRIKVPSLKIPEIKLPPIPIEISGLPHLEIELPPIKFPSLDFKLPRINLASLVTPEIKIPKIALPKPYFRFGFEGVDIKLENLLLGLLLKEAGITEPWCVSFDFPFSVFQRIYPDYVFSWPDLPRIPKIPFCEDIQKFCKRANSAINAIASRAKDIEEHLNKKFEEKIQKELNRIAEEIQEQIKNNLEEQLKTKIGEKIKTELEKHIAQSTAVTSPQTKLPIPGVWPLGRVPCDKVPPLTISFEDLIVSIPISAIATFPSGTIHIDWPANLKEISLPCDETKCNECGERGKEICHDRYLKDKDCPSFAEQREFTRCKTEYIQENCKNECKGCLMYDLPSIPLCKLKISKQKEFSLPGLQSATLPTVDFDFLTRTSECVSQKPSGGNPCQSQVEGINNNLEKIKTSRDKIDEFFQNIEKILL